MTSKLVSLRSALNEIAGKVTPYSVPLQDVSQGPDPSTIDSSAADSAHPAHKQYPSSS